MKLAHLATAVVILASAFTTAALAADLKAKNVNGLKEATPPSLVIDQQKAAKAQELKELYAGAKETPEKKKAAADKERTEIAKGKDNVLAGVAFEIKSHPGAGNAPAATARPTFMKTWQPTASPAQKDMVKVKDGFGASGSKGFVIDTNARGKLLASGSNPTVGTFERHAVVLVGKKMTAVQDNSTTSIGALTANSSGDMRTSAA